MWITPPVKEFELFFSYSFVRDLHRNLATINVVEVLNSNKATQTTECGGCSYSSGTSTFPIQSGRWRRGAQGSSWGGVTPSHDTSSVTFPKGFEALVLAHAPHSPSSNVFCICRLLSFFFFKIGKEPSHEELSVFRYVNVSVLRNFA